jgi:ATP-dependent protease ClpP protease subunit
MPYPEEYVAIAHEYATKGKIMCQGQFNRDMEELVPNLIYVAGVAAKERGQEWLTIQINSYGGEVAVLDAIRAAMYETRLKFVGFVMTRAMSAAFDLLQHCDWRVGLSGMLLMAHYGNTGMSNAMLAVLHESPKMALELERARIEESLQFYARRSGLPAKRIHELCRSDIRFTANQALAMGFLDEVIEPAPTRSTRPPADYPM